MSPLHFPENDVGFVGIAISREKSDGIAHFLLAIDALRNLFAIVANETACRIHNSLGRAIVAFEFEELGSWINLSKAQDIVDVCASEAINALCVVAHYTYPLPLVGKKPDNLMLSEVRVLILIDENEVEALLPMCRHFWIMFENEPHVEQQVVEVHRIRLFASFLIAIINLRCKGAMIEGIVLAKLANRGIARRQDESVLGS